MVKAVATCISSKSHQFGSCKLQLFSKAWLITRIVVYVSIYYIILSTFCNVQQSGI